MRLVSLLGAVSLAGAQKNVVMIIVDDLRPMIKGWDGSAFQNMVTPHLDSLVKDSLILRESHVQQAECGPSRASILTGRRPDTTHIYELTTYFRDVGCATCVTIPGAFKNAGYRTFGLGKVFHPLASSGYDNDGNYSWSEPYFEPEDMWCDKDSGGCMNPNGNQCKDDDEVMAASFSWEAVVEPDPDLGYLTDTLVAMQFNATLDALYPDTASSTASNSSSAEATDDGQSGDSGPGPWFIAVGFHKPHLPFIVPEEFFDLYPLDDDEAVPLASNPYAPAYMPQVAYASYELETWGDVSATGFTGAVNVSLEDSKAREEVRAYQAGVSYMDSCVGSVMNALKAKSSSSLVVTGGAASSLWDDTIVLFWSDHGWKLGQHGAWSKHTNFRTDTHAPVMLRVPGRTDGGLVSDALVEHVDLLPTALDAAGLGAPPLCPKDQPWLTAYCSEGLSFLPLVNDPSQVWKNASYSQYPRQLASATPIMGYSMHVASTSSSVSSLVAAVPSLSAAPASGGGSAPGSTLRFTAWVIFNATTNTTDFSMDCSKCEFELYDHVSDPDENLNLAGADTSEGMVELLQVLFQQLQAGWRATAGALGTLEN